MCRAEDKYGLGRKDRQRITAWCGDAVCVLKIQEAIPSPRRRMIIYTRHGCWRGGEIEGLLLLHDLYLSDLL